MRPDKENKPKLWLRKLGQRWAVWQCGKIVCHGSEVKCRTFMGASYV